MLLKVHEECQCSCRDHMRVFVCDDRQDTGEISGNGGLRVGADLLRLFELLQCEQTLQLGQRCIVIIVGGLEFRQCGLHGCDLEVEQCLFSGLVEHGVLS